MARTKAGNTPLHFAVHRNHSAFILRFLMHKGADVIAQNENGETPLHFDALYLINKPGVIQALLTAGADGKAKNKDGKTPWDLAQENEKLEGTKAYRALNDAQYN